jgi:hypothetical protein
MSSSGRSRIRRRSDLTPAVRLVGAEDATLLDIVDNVLNKGVVLSGDLTIALAQVDLIYARVSFLLCAADRVLPHESREPPRRDVATHTPGRTHTRRVSR